LRTIAVCAGCALASSALADEQPNRGALEKAVFSDTGLHPVDNERLEELRGRLPGPAILQPAGVVLWDEPRKGLPPQRGATSEAPPAVNGGGVGITINHR
jgi:hypothetical protein